MIGPITQSSGLLTENAVRILARTTSAGSKNEAKIELEMKKTGEKE